MDYKAELVKIVKSDPWMMQVLESARKLNLPDWMIGAGFVRNKVWDSVTGRNNYRTAMDDVDLIYFDQDNLSEDTEKQFDKKLLALMPEVNWSCKNSARMHKINNNPPFKSNEQALAHWVETATCVAVRLEDDDSISIFAPHGLEDLFSLSLKPTPNIDLATFEKRAANKPWLSSWPELKVIK